MNGIWFDEIHSFTDLNLILSKVDLPPATVKTSYVDNPGGDGSWDLTEATGKINYKNRDCKFTFSVLPTDDFEQKKTEVSNLLNGRRYKVVLDKDPGYFWDGRCTVNKYESKKKLRQIVVSANVAPYKYKTEQTNVFVPFCGKNLLNVSEDNQISQLYGTVEYIENGFRKSGKYFVGFRAYVKKNTQYFLGCDIAKIVQAPSPGNGGRIAIYDITNTKSIAHFPSSDGHAVFTFNSGNYTEFNVLFYSDSDEELGVYEFTNIQLEAIQATEYEPYTPTTDPQEVILTNGRKSVSPTIYCTGEATIVADGAEYTVGEGTHKILDLQLQEGATPITVSGTGAVTFVYQEGDL